MELVKAKRILNTKNNNYTDQEIIAIIKYLKEIISADINKNRR